MTKKRSMKPKAGPLKRTPSYASQEKKTQITNIRMEREYINIRISNIKCTFSSKCNFLPINLTS